VRKITADGMVTSLQGGDNGPDTQGSRTLMS
jgi:hypothetical protein